jgi:hypothetical protein
MAPSNIPKRGEITEETVVTGSRPPEQEARPPEPAEETVVAGGKPSASDKFFLEAQWRLVEKAPEILEQAGKDMMTVTSLLSGIYLAALQLGKLPELLPVGWRLVLLLPYGLWLPAFLCAWRVFSPERLLLPQDAPEATREKLSELAQRKARWLRAAQGLLFIGLVLMVVVVLFMFVIAGEVSP